MPRSGSRVVPVGGNGWAAGLTNWDISQVISECLAQGPGAPSEASTGILPIYLLGPELGPSFFLQLLARETKSALAPGSESQENALFPVPHSPTLIPCLLYPMVSPSCPSPRPPIPDLAHGWLFRLCAVGQGLKAWRFLSCWGPEPVVGDPGSSSGKRLPLLQASFVGKSELGRTFWLPCFLLGWELVLGTRTRLAGSPQSPLQPHWVP